MFSTPAVTAPAASLSGGTIAGITIGVLLVILIILAIVIVIAVVVYKRQASKQPKIKRHDEEKVSVDFDKQWLMADHELPKKKKVGFVFVSQSVLLHVRLSVYFLSLVELYNYANINILVHSSRHTCEYLVLVPLQASFRRGRSLVDGTEEVIIRTM